MLKVFRFKILYLSLYLLLNSAMYSQKIEVYIFLKNPCDSSIKELDIYELRKDTVRYLYVANLNTSPMTVSDTGIYNLSSASIFGDEILSIKNRDKYIDTLRETVINEVLPLHQKQKKSYWVCCNEKCNGYKIDYYDNGNKKIEGNFKKGKAIGKIKFYNPDGSIFFIEYFNKRGKYIRREYYQ